MTFWVRQKFPAIILCFVLAVKGEMKESLNCEICFYINGDEVFELEMPRSFQKWWQIMCGCMAYELIQPSSGMVLISG